jgi:hypothetical protein
LRSLIQALGVIALLAVPAIAQQPPKVPTRGLILRVPALYWAKISAVIAKRMPAFPNGLSARVRLYMTQDGAVTEAVFVRHSGVDAFDRILERELSEFAVTAADRLPVPADKKMRAGVMRDGVTVVVRSRFKPKAGAKAKRSGGQRINFRAGMLGMDRRGKSRNTPKLKAAKPTTPKP